ncbi:MAG: G5 domain-containing protein [Patescibacteria group bacterium]|nr:G5 domain-containing protein [Patescibacteria group bacterium]
MEKIKAIIYGIGFVALILVISFGIGTANRVKGAENFWCLQRVVVSDDNVISEFWATETNLDLFFINNNLLIYPEDKKRLSLPLMACKGSLIKIDRAPVISLKIGKNESMVRSWAQTVADLLKEKDIVLGSRDKIEPALGSKITNNMKIVLTHWGERIEKKEEPVAFEVEKRPSADLVIGNTEVLESGIDGVKEVVYKITSVNGDDVSSEKISEKVVEPAKNRIILYGTKPPTTYLATGQAKWYIRTGEMLAACNLVPRGTRLLITNLSNGKWIEATASGGNNGFSYPVVVDLSTAAFEGLGVSLGQGVIYNVQVEIIN